MVGEEYFINPTGLYAAIALIPFIILYLIKPKPQHRVLPSLMFLLRDRDKNRFNAFFRTLLRQLLFFLQLLTILALIAVIAQPYIPVPGHTVQTDTVFILDSSASMQTTMSTGTRADAARQRVLDNLAAHNTIILAGTVPDVALEDADREEAREYMRTWKPGDTPTRLTNAILAAQDYARDGTRVMIISDFADTDPDFDWRDAVTTLQTKGPDVVLEQVGEPSAAVDNVGIVDVEVSEAETVVDVHNYGVGDETVKVCANNFCQELAIPGASTATWKVNTPAGETTLLIDHDDALAVDNTAYVSASTQNSVRALVITNEDFTSTYLYYALQAIMETTPLTITFETNTPPTLIDRVDHDLVIISAVDQDVLVSRTMRQATTAVKEGSAAIVLYQDDVFGLDLGDLLPAVYVEAGGFSRVVNTESSRAFTGIDYGTTPQYHRATPRSNAQVLAMSDDEYALIVLASLGRGKVLYYGLPESASFTTDPLYPVFWRNALYALSGRTPVEELNRPTGSVLTALSIELPGGAEKTGSVVLSQTGFYMVGAESIAASLLDAQESNTRVPDLTADGVARVYERDIDFRQRELTDFVIAAIFLFMILELVYVKWRGDA